MISVFPSTQRGLYVVYPHPLGQVLAACSIALGFIWGAMQGTAAQLGYQAELGLLGNIRARRSAAKCAANDAAIANLSIARCPWSTNIAPRPRSIVLVCQPHLGGAIQPGSSFRHSNGFFVSFR